MLRPRKYRRYWKSCQEYSDAAFTTIINPADNIVMLSFGQPEAGHIIASSQLDLQGFVIMKIMAFCNNKIYFKKVYFYHAQPYNWKQKKEAK